jgi:hypothetical protein
MFQRIFPPQPMKAVKVAIVRVNRRPEIFGVRGN